MLLIDTGIFVAAADRTEPRHNACATLLRNEADLAVTAATIPEAAWLIESRLGPPAEARFLNLVTSTRFTIIDLTDNDYQRAIALINSYTISHSGSLMPRSLPSPNDSARPPSPRSTNATSQSCALPTTTPSGSFPDDR